MTNQYAGLNATIRHLEQVAFTLNAADCPDAGSFLEFMRGRPQLAGSPVNRVLDLINDVIGDDAIYEQYVNCFGDMPDVEQWLHDRDRDAIEERVAPSRALKDIVRAPYAFPGGYPKYLVTSDCACICKDCAKKEFKTLMRSTVQRAQDGWQVVAADINWCNDLYCDHCSEQIESAYGHEESA